jgi:formate dehydrogenase iron-sulfur subunit
MPACVEACPEKATIFGSRDEMIREAHHRIKSNPQRYLQAVVGESEVGGTSVIYISDISLAFLGYKPELGNQPLPDLTWSAISKVPALILGVGGLATGIYWIIERRMKLSTTAAPQQTSEEKKGNDR